MAERSIQSRAQVNIALSSTQYEVLQAISFVEDQSVPELLRPLVQEYVDRMADDHAVQLALQARALTRARTDAGVTSITKKARKAGNEDRR